jgi:hypothetical protein
MSLSKLSCCWCWYTSLLFYFYLNMQYIPILRDIDFSSIYMRMNEMVRVYLYQDFHGQRLATNAYRVILTVVLFIAMGVSFVTQKLSHGVYIMIGGMALSMLVTIDLFRYVYLHGHFSIDKELNG